MEEDSLLNQIWFWAGIIMLIVVMVAFSPIVIIDQTEVGVVKTFGQVSGTMGAGLHLIIPFVQEVVRMPTFQKTVDFSGDNRIMALSSEGLDVSFDMAIQYAVNPSMAEKVYTDLKDPEVWMHSRVRAKARDIVASYKVESLYTGADRQAVQAKFESELDKEFEQYGIVMKAVLIREVKLPDSVVVSIQSKISAKQDAERMEFVIQKETLEKQRRIIEAEGISKANEIIASSLTENYLRWYWIQHVVMSANSSIMYVPVGDDGLPLMKTV
jgi:regulator of protease activity HflC (stomatin/prohibitin superfamily)